MSIGIVTISQLLSGYYFVILKKNLRNLIKCIRPNTNLIEVKIISYLSSAFFMINVNF